MKTNELIEHVCAKLGIPALNAMQQAAIETCNHSRNVILLSPTGSGKTLAYLIPLLLRIRQHTTDIQALVIVPTRELAQQVDSVLRSISSGIKITCCHGGHSFRDEARSLEGAPSVVIGTPGRLLDHMQRGRLSIGSVHTLILDEFDKSLELGFHNEMRSLVQPLRNTGLRILTSATDLKELPDFISMPSAAKLYFTDNAQKAVANPKLTIYAVASPGKDKLETLYQLLCHIDNAPTLIFCNQRESVERVATYLKSLQIECAVFHGGMEQPDRERALCRFRNHSVNICIATDLAARGLDITAVGHIIHYHLPLDAEAYTHRNGRTARMEAEGNAYLIIAPQEEIPIYVDDIRYLRLDSEPHQPETPLMETLHFAAGKKEKLSKSDILGFLTRCCELPASEVGLIEVKDHYSYAAVTRKHVAHILQTAATEKIKGKRIRISKAK